MIEILQKSKRDSLSFTAAPKNRHPALASGDQWENPKLYYHYNKATKHVNGCG
jgi:hypothetical protein